MDTQTFSQAIEENQLFLQQLARLLQQLSPHAYTAMQEPFPKGGIGKHVRHTLEHYQALLAGGDQGAGSKEPRGVVVDYDSRVRDHDLESDARQAVELIGEIITRLHALAAASSGETPVQVAYTRTDGVISEQILIPSTLMRELTFVASHTVHHLALIDLIARAQGIQPPQDFGVALSTLRYLQHAS